MVRIGDGRVLRLMARVAVSRSARVASADVAIGAGNRRVCTRKREERLDVIEDRGDPCTRVGAYLAIRRESAGDVVRIRCLLEVRLVAGDAGGAETDEHPAGMATTACERYMRTRQRECCLGVVEYGAQPIRRAVADRAVVGEAGGNVIGIRGLLEGRKVASRTLRWRAGKTSACVTLRAGNSGMCSGERENGGAVIKRGGQP